MTILKTIVYELEAASEPLLLKVLDFIQTAKTPEDHFESSSSSSLRVADLHQGQVWISEDFNDPLPDDFWLGED